MASSAFPALAINTQGESPVNLLGKIEQIKSAQQSQQMGAIQLQEARVAQQSREALMAAFSKNDGDFNQTLADARNSGKVTPTDLLNFQEKSVAIQTNAAKLTSEQLANTEKEHDMVANEFEAFKALPVEQRTPDAVKASIGRLASNGVDVSKMLPAFQSIAQNPTDENIRNLELGFKGAQWVLANEKAQREAASAPTPGQAQTKIQAELSEAVDKAAAAHISLLSMPSPQEAKTERAAKLLQTQAQTAEAQASTAQKKAETALLGAQPVFAFDPAANQRVLTTMPDAKQKGYTNPVKVSESDINKEVEATKQFNDVQMNVSRYKNAFKSSSIPITGDQAVSMERILSDKELAGMVGSVTSPQFWDSLNQGRIARDWNNLTPENQDLAIGYFRSKGSIIAYQKALTQVGRTSKEAMEIEMNNLPSPLEGGTVGLKRLDSFQQNIDTATQGQTRVPWLPSTGQIRQSIEGEFDKGRPAPRPLPQPGSNPSLNVGGFINSLEEGARKIREGSQ